MYNHDTNERTHLTSTITNRILILSGYHKMRKESSHLIWVNVTILIPY